MMAYDGKDAALDDATREVLADDLVLLARLHDCEPDAALLEALRGVPVAEWFALRVCGDDFSEGCRLIGATLSSLPWPIDQATLNDLAAEYAAIYLTFAYRAAPTESVWLDEDGLERQAAMFAVRRRYRELGFQVPDWRQRSDDHLVFELQAQALALRQASDVDDLRAAARFLRLHLLAWVPAFAARVATRCRLPFYAGVALLTVAYLNRLAALLGDLTGEDMTPPPPQPRRHEGVRPPSCADPPPAYVPGVAPGW